MCGFTGFWTNSQVFDRDGLLERIQPMTQALNHRGPDDNGQWLDESLGLALGHARLAIMDLSPAGHQPMVSSTSRYVMIFNGEIYNHLSLRERLQQADQAPQWVGHSDTETLLAAFEVWGIEATLQASVGMFAIAVWDVMHKTLTLARDRMGEKPLYYGLAGEGTESALVFGSELKALRTYPGFNRSVCRQALAQYIRFSYVPAPLTIHPGVFKLEPGCMLTIHDSPPRNGLIQPLRPNQQIGNVSLKRWWSLRHTVETGAADLITDEQAAIKALQKTLMQSVSDQSLADVPLGAFLSGGVDSSTIVSLMQLQASKPVKTFTIGFDETQFDESPYADAVAKHLGTEHYNLRVSAKMALDVIPKLPWMYDEPFADSSQIPTHLVCVAAKSHVTVALSGDAGDELLGGYNRYFWGPNLWQKLAWLPLNVRRLLGQMMLKVPPSQWDMLIRPLLRSDKEFPQFGYKIHKLAVRLQTVKTVDDLYLMLVSAVENPDDWLQSSASFSSIATLLSDPLPSIGMNASASRMMFHDSLTYLPDDILVKVDRAAMATSLETRVPFLDHRVVELAWRLPLNMKIRRNKGKWALRQILYQYVPEALIERPKAGFALPIGQWLIGPLFEWADALLQPQRIENEGYFNAATISKVWQEHQSGRFDHSAKLWTILMFQAWLDEL